MAQQSIVLTCKAKSFIENYLLFLLNTFYLKKNNYSGPFPNFKKKNSFQVTYEPKCNFIIREALKRIKCNRVLPFKIFSFMIRAHFGFSLLDTFPGKRFNSCTQNGENSRLISRPPFFPPKGLLS